MLTISAAEVDHALTFPGLVETLRAAFRDGAVQPVRHHHTVERPDGAASTLLLMPAWTDFNSAGTSAGGHIGVKIVTVSPDNNAVGKPAVMGLYLLLDGATGEPEAMIDGQRLTQWRTACASALAASYLAREDASRLLVVGAGALSPFLARAHSAVRPITAIRIWNRTPANAEKVAAELRAEGFAASAASDLDAELGQADIVSSATITTTPLIKGALLKPGAHVDLVGGFTPAMRESDDDAIARARVYVDTRAGATKEAGDIVQPLASGVLKAQAIVADLHELARGQKKGRQSPGEITLFKSVGAALEDLAAGIAVYKALKSRGVGEPYQSCGFVLVILSLLPYSLTPLLPYSPTPVRTGTSPASRRCSGVMEIRGFLLFWSILAAVVAALSLGLSFAHVLESAPRLTKWSPSLWRETTVFNAQFQLFAVIGAPLDVAAIGCPGLLAWMLRNDRPAFWFALAAALLYAVSLAMWFALVKPANDVLATWVAGPIPENFEAIRLRWETGHMIVAGFKAVGFVSLVVALLWI